MEVKHRNIAPFQVLNKIIRNLVFYSIAVFRMNCSAYVRQQTNLDSITSAGIFI